IPYKLAVVAIAAVLLFYVTIGGMRAVIWTDAVQAVMLVLGMIVIAIFVATDSTYINQAVNTQSNIYRSEMPTTYLWTLSAGYALSMPMWPHLYQRFFAARDRKGAFSIGLSNDLGSIFLLTLGAAIIGYAGVGAFPDAVPDTITALFIKALPLGIAMPMAAAGTAAAMSTADSILLTSSAIGTKDVYIHYKGTTTDAQDSRIIARILTSVLMLIALVAALQPPELILQYVIDLAYPGFLLLLPPTIAGLYWRRATGVGAVAGMLSGLVTLVLTTFVWENALDIYPGIWGLVVSSIVL